MNSRELVIKVFEGEEPERVPTHFESGNKDEEAALSDVIGIGAKVSEWRKFYRTGGPFRRLEGESLLSWASRIRVDAYDWPPIDQVVNSAISAFEREAKRFVGRYFMMGKVLGPAETCEGFFAPKQPPEAEAYDEIMHRFDFALYMKLRFNEAIKIFEKVAKYVLELVKAVAEIEYVDAVRVADDAAAYTGAVYDRRFYEVYLRWHREFANAIKSRGKFAVVHCDGDIERAGLLEHFARDYNAIHPLDLQPKVTVEDCVKWHKRIVDVRRKLAEKGLTPVFFTGVPIDLIFREDIAAQDLAHAVKNFVASHGKKFLVIATTHSPYPGRSYGEEGARAKVEAIRKALAGV